MKLLFAARRFRQGFWRSAGIGLAIFAFAFLVRWSIRVDGFPFITFFPAVLAAGILGGVSAGVICAVLAELAARFYFVSPLFYVGLNTATSLIPLLLFALAAGVELVLIGLLNRAIDELWLARERSNTLFGELQHRVANNLQFVAALLQLQRRLPLTKDDALLAAQSRLDLIGRIHRRLYDPSNADRPIVDFLREFCNDIIASSGAAHVALDVQSSPIKLDFDKIIPLALIVAEVVTNSLKHAFADRADGAIRIVLEDGPAPSCTLIISDNGRGCGKTTNDGSGTGLGRRIIESLAQQLDAKVRTSSDDGTRVAVIFQP